MPGALDGIRVISWTAWHAGSEATTLLADMGAEVIKIEQPRQGDMMRGLMYVDRFYIELPGKKNAVFEVGNRNSKSLTLDLTKEKGREVLFELVKKSDVFFTNFFRPAEKLGLDYAHLSQVNPRIVYGKLSGYGSRGPYKDKAGYDPQGLALSGLMDVWRGNAETPQLPQFAMLDQATAIMAAFSVTAALVAREKQGIGQEVEVSLLSTGTSILYGNITVALLLGKEFVRHNREKTANPLRNYYRCADGRWLIGAHTPPDRYWPDFCRALGLQELQNDPRFATTQAREDNCEEIIRLLDGVFASKTSVEWLRIFQDFRELSFTPVNRVSDLAQEPQVMENGLIIDFDHPTLGKVKMPGFPMEFSKTPWEMRMPAPELGQHTEEVLHELLGYSWEKIGQLKEEGIV